LPRFWLDKLNPSMCICKMPPFFNPAPVQVIRP
jgi:hypothetical protein